MTISWFRGDTGRLPMKEAVKALYPPNKSSHWEQQRRSEDRSRFSNLLLEHGEKSIQDWAVIAYTSHFTIPGPLAARSPRKLGSTQWAQSTTKTTVSSNTTTNTTTATTATATTTFKGKSSKRKVSSRTKPEKRIDKDTFPTVHMTKIEGRLHICSLSLVFEPTDPTRGIVRCPFARMDSPPKEYPSSTDPATTSTGTFEPMCVEFTASRHVVMKTNNVIGPFEGVAVPTLFRFTFLHSSPSSLVDLSQRLFHILNHGENKPGRVSPELNELIRPMLDRPFDPTNLVDVRERPLSPNLRASHLTPLQAKPGCIVVTAERIYFQPASGILSLENTKATNWLQSHVVATARRYRGLKDCALEIYFRDSTSVLFAMERTHEREQLLRLMPLGIPCHTDRDFVVQASQEWQKGSITNYEYLLLLNSSSGRTFHDLSRYPVFPWVIADYESSRLDLSKQSTFRDLTKPVGALNKKRLEYFRQRYESMRDMEDPFLYGTHYSAAGYVLYYLIRSMPEHMLCLQNGKFDAPDRMFHSISHCFNCVLTNHADVKELIPEFYNPNNDFDFLINAKSLQLGATQNGDRVDDVSLPPWAKSPRDFLKKNRKALESELCTSMLPRWIDLIFGSKSRGEAAKEASNLFHKMAYLGPADLSGMASEEERFQAELQATEFGIVPDQLFIGPHPLRHETVDESFVRPDIGRAFSGTEEPTKGEAWELLDPPSQSSQDSNRPDRAGSYGSDLDHAATPQPTVLGGGGAHPVSGANQESTHHSLPPRPEDPFRPRTEPTVVLQQQQGKTSSSSGRDQNRVWLPLSGSGEGGERQSGSGGGAFSLLGQEPSLSNVSSSSGAPFVGASPNKPDSGSFSAQASGAEWDMKIIERLRVHEDSVSGCCLTAEASGSSKLILATTSLDGGLKVHSASLSMSDFEDKQKHGLSGTFSRFTYITMTRGQVTPSNQNKLSEYRSHTARDPLACLVVASDGYGGQVAFAGGHDDVVLAYGINSACAVASVYSHRDAVTGLDLLSRNPLSSETALWLESSTHIMISGSWDATVKVWSVTVATGETVSINREPLAELFDADSPIVCVSAAVLLGSGVVIGAGCADGSFCVWNLHNDGVKVVVHKEPARRGSGPCSVVQWCEIEGKMYLFAGFATGKVASFLLSDGSMRKVSAVSVGVAVQCLVYSENILLVGCADGGLRLIPVRDGAHFASNPTLWPAVNSKSAPGISSISITYMTNPVTKLGRCICSTGAEDGSVALFELKKVSTASK